MFYLIDKDIRESLNPEWQYFKMIQGKKCFDELHPESWKKVLDDWVSASDLDDTLESIVSYLFWMNAICTLIIVAMGVMVW